MLTRELLKKIRRIEIVTARQAQNLLAGAYQSVFKGLGMAFSEVRQYQPGDDVRLIDWNVTARMDDAYVKLFVEEREMSVMLLVDASGSGGFGSREQRKREVAAEIGALLAFSAIKNNDRIGLVIFTDRVERFVPPMKGKKHVLALVSEILRFQPSSLRTLSAPDKGQAARAPLGEGDPPFPPERAAPRHQGRPGVPGGRRAPPLGALPHLRLPRRGWPGEFRQGAAHRAPPPRRRAGHD